MKTMIQPLQGWDYRNGILFDYSWKSINYNELTGLKILSNKLTSCTGERYPLFQIL